MEPAGPERRVESFVQDDDGEWVAVLSCGHRRHVRHAPPMTNHAWVTAPEGRAEKIGAVLECRHCLMGTLPAGASVYRTTAWFDEKTIPSGLLRSHRLAKETWGRIVVSEGRLLYVLEGEPEIGFLLSPALAGVVEPERPHRVEPRGPMRFRVEFLRE